MSRVAIIGGCRTPFVKAGGAFARASFLDMGIHVVTSLVRRLAIDPDSIDELAFSTVLLDPRLPNAAREIVLRSDLPNHIGAHFVSNNCISGLVAIDVIANAIRAGRIKNGLAGGSESMSRPTLTLRSDAEKFYLSLARTRGIAPLLGQLLKFRPGFCLPVPPSPKEPSTGLTMGEHCELTAKEMSISRSAQDEIAYKSHLHASKAQQQGMLGMEIEPFQGVEHDNLVRKDTSLEKLAKLAPVFDRSGSGTLTAGNSSALTDGASVVFLVSEDEARRQGREILGFIEGVEFAAIDPQRGLLMAPALALPKLMKRLGLSIADVDRFEIHEAFGAQVAANLKAWEEGWGDQSELTKIGTIPAERINQAGGSIAIGHPFAATGGRLVLSALHQLKRDNLKRAAISVCAAGGMACAMTVTRQ